MWGLWQCWTDRGKVTTNKEQGSAVKHENWGDSLQNYLTDEGKNMVLNHYYLTITSLLE